MSDTSAPELRQKLSSATHVHLLGPMPGVLPPLWDAPLILVDGGAHSYKGGAQQVLWVGDGDSGSVPPGVAALSLPPAKDISDLRAALDLLGPNTLKLDLWGLSGGRHDHELANWGEVHRFLKSRPQSQATFHTQHLRLEAYGPGRWKLDLQGRYSLMVLESCQVRMFGECQYPIDPPRMLGACSSLGISNQGQGLVDIHTGGAFFIFAG